MRTRQKVSCLALLALVACVNDQENEGKEPDVGLVNGGKIETVYSASMAYLKVETLDTFGVKPIIPFEEPVQTLAKSSVSSTLVSAATKSHSVGIMPTGTNEACPTGSTKITISFDDEDSHNRNEATNFTALWVLGNNTTHVYCKLSESESLKFFNIGGGEMHFEPYAVLKLGDECPNGGYTVSRYHDTEDNSNKNSSTGPISPNVVNDNIRLYFCYYPGEAFDGPAPYHSDFPTISGFSSYGVFSNNAAQLNAYHGSRLHDDEDNSNSNSLSVPSMPAKARSALSRVMYTGSNTTYYLSRITP